MSHPKERWVNRKHCVLCKRLTPVLHRLVPAIDWDRVGGHADTNAKIWRGVLLRNCPACLEGGVQPHTTVPSTLHVCDKYQMDHFIFCKACSRQEGPHVADLLAWYDTHIAAEVAETKRLRKVASKSWTDMGRLYIGSTRCGTIYRTSAARREEYERQAKRAAKIRQQEKQEQLVAEAKADAEAEEIIRLFIAMYGDDA